jgi:hypothetical protein
MGSGLSVCAYLLSSLPRAIGGDLASLPQAVAPERLFAIVAAGTILESFALEMTGCEPV